MTANVSVFNSDVRLLGLEAEKLEARAEFRYFGTLERENPLTVSALDDEYRTWVCVACRSGSATVAISATSQPQKTYVVGPGCPLFYLPQESHAVQEVEVSPVDSMAEVEVYLFASSHLISPPVPEFLILNAGTGVTTDEFDASVSSWRDTRSNSLAPLEFPWSDSEETKPVLIESDPDFGGKPSISFAESGEGRFLYSTVPPALFDFMNGGENFTVMAIMSAPDNALDDSSALNAHQGVWGTPESGSHEGGHALIESGYRHMTSFGQFHTDYIMGEDELVEKPFVIIWHFTGQTLRVYWQGRWHTEETLPAGTGSSGLLGVGAATQQGTMRYLRGKIADLRVYNRHATETERAAYIEMAVNEYGIDDTAEQGFPWVSSCVNMHRANRGITWEDEEESTLTSWWDVRWRDSTSGARAFAPDDEDGYWSPVLVAADERLGGRPAFSFDGEEMALVNPFSAGSGNHLVGRSVGLTVTFVFYHVGNPADSPLMSMGVYTSNDDGTEIAFFNIGDYPNLYYRTDESISGNAMSEEGPSDFAQYTPMAIVFRLNGSDKWWIDEMNLSTGEHLSLTGAYDTEGTMTDGTTSPVYMGAYESAGQYFPGSIAEMTTADIKVSNAQVLEFFEYARRLYAAA